MPTKVELTKELAAARERISELEALENYDADSIEADQARHLTSVLVEAARDCRTHLGSLRTLDSVIEALSHRAIKIVSSQTDFGR